MAATGGVDINGFPQLLMTREFGDPDTLLSPLLASAREALQACKSVSTSGTGGASQAGLMAAIHLATSLLKDSNFTLGSKGSQTENYYFLDLVEERIQVRTWLFATINKRTSSFLVRITGNLKTGMFSVAGADEGVLAEFDEKRMAQGEFFSSVLSEECLRLQMSKERFKRFGDLPVVQGESGIKVNLQVSNGTVPVLLKKKEKADTWKAIDEQTSENLGALAPEASEQLEKVLAALSKMLRK